MFQSIMSVIVSVICLFGGLFMLYVGLFLEGFFSGATLLGLFLVVFNVWGLYTRFFAKNDQGTREEVPMPDVQAPATEATRPPQVEGVVAVQQAYDALDAETAKRLFYGDEVEAKTTLAEVVPMFVERGNLDGVSAAREAVGIYSQVWIRKHIGNSPEFMGTDSIKSALADRCRYLDAETIGVIVDLYVAFIYQHEPELEQRDELVELTQAFVQSNASKNTEAETAHLDEADYGLVPEKPVFVAGMFGLDAYLQSLRLDEDTSSQITFNRLGSKNVQGIQGPVDVYEVLVGDRVLTHIYLCIYGNANSIQAPKGFVLR